MRRRWCVGLAMLALTVSAALNAGSASAAPAEPVFFSPGEPIHLVGTDGAHGRGLGVRAKSTNWSGYAVTTGSYTSVSASWTQPAGICSRGDRYAAFWAGLDGYTSSTVEQTGSEVDCAGRTARYYAWYEIYPGPSESYSSTVRPGDHFTATVTYLGGEEFSLHIADTTQSWSHTTDASLSQTPSLSSAEAIVEAPCCTFSGGILPLTDFGTMSFTGSTANGSAIGNAGGLTEITMVDSAGRDKDRISALSGGENFSATWLRSN
jgi:Peptidase A4 family